MGVVRPVHVAWVVLAVATATVGFASASCGSGNGQAGSSLSSVISSAGSGLPTSAPSVTVTTTSPPVTTTTTSPGTTVLGLAAGSTASTEPTGSESGASGWAYALIGAVIVALIVGVVWLFRRGKASPAVPVATPKPLAERQAILLAEVEQRLRSGWTVVSQTADTATLERSGGVTRITVDEFGTLHEIPTGPTE